MSESEAGKYRDNVDQLADGVEKAVIRSVREEDAVAESIERMVGVRDKMGALKGLLGSVIEATDELKEAIANEEQEGRETSGHIMGSASEAEGLLRLADKTLEGTGNQDALDALANVSGAQEAAAEAAYNYEQGRQGVEWLLGLADGLRQAFDTAGGVIARLEQRTTETTESFSAAKTNVEDEVVGNQTALQKLQTYQEKL
jgi:hypothetical protein